MENDLEVNLDHGDNLLVFRQLCNLMIAEKKRLMGFNLDP